MKNALPAGRLFTALIILLAAVCGAWAQPTVQIGLNFVGSSYLTNSQAVPPDGNGVIGPTRFLEFVNGSVVVYNRTNGNSVKRESDLIFWANAGLAFASSQVVTDPRVIYDPASQRWFATQVDFDGNATDPTTEANDFLLAVSTTSNPAGTWKAFKFQADPDNGDFADFPTLGLDANAVYISGDFFSSSVAIGPGLVSIPKADLISATPTITNMTWYGVMDYATRGDVLQPAVCFDGSATGNILAMGDIGSDSLPHSNVVSFVVQNGGTTNATLTASTQITVLPYEVPDNVDLGVPQFTALQPDRTQSLQANDPRLSAKIFAVGGVLYATHNTEYNGHIAIRWYRIRASDSTLLEQGTISDPNLDLYFPSIAANQYGVVVICCNGSGSGTNNFISSYAYAGQTSNGQTTFGNSILLCAGVDNYHDLYDISGLAPTSRWGDYSTMSVDPADPMQFWTIQTVCSGIDQNSGLGESIWSENITQLIITSQLTISRSGANVLVTWPLYASPHRLFSATNLTPPVVWSAVSQPAITNGPQITTTVPLGKTPEFFSLQ